MTPEFNPVRSRARAGGASPFGTAGAATSNGVNPRDFDVKSIRLIVGLGNPGAQYAHTYHNAGRIAVRALENAPSSPFAPRCRFLFPDTFMNESGSAVKRALPAWPAGRRVKSSRLLLVHDDADLPLGSHRLAFARGAAGHHGVESVIRALGTKEFWRLRIGVRPPAFKNAKADAFVLRPMTKAAEAKILTAVESFREQFSPQTGQ